ncbi:hypothetical protein [Vibrio anguillarum]|uniref:Uncharacterized protein n=1 Tax=Vibrio anguillarum TaxID=55601 RepID=A0A7U6J6D0_VIBAN|nr:hypothetical protein [Vibrio anguillarum]AZS26224.1 hypothetical protein DYL72_15055 [Vibrio anguillarum]AZS26377.1 hypothetical protein DYL72_15855 [Vibrio anguillarum]MBF4374504.1 hypothetical protein [Vibrio anguillarum]MBF4437748.1 hypothetical protein [Vibrio anguillarum]
MSVDSIRITRKALIVSAEEDDCCDGVYVLSVDNPATFQFEALNCSPAEFAQWYLLKLGRNDFEYAEYRVSDDNRHVIWLWVDEHGLTSGEELTITSDEIFECWLNQKLQDTDRELSKMAKESLDAILCQLSPPNDEDWEIPY